jgi:formate dehydrogenase iron-sulfur subunit
MLYDNSRCIGCRACQMACKQWNDLPPQSTDPQGIYESPYGLSPAAWTLIRLSRYPVNERRNWVFMKEGCMHCGEPGCVAVCPTGALKKQPNGLVTYARELCNGCGYCTQFCPFGVPQLEVADPITGAAKSSKCTFCQDRVADDLRPFCIESCPAGALEWGDREAMLAEAKSRVDALKGGEFPEANLYGEKELGGLGRLYVLLAPPTVYGLPQNPKFPASASLWQRIVQPLGQVTFGLAGLGIVAAFFAARHNVHMEEIA